VALSQLWAIVAPSKPCSPSDDMASGGFDSPVSDTSTKSAEAADASHSGVGGQDSKASGGDGNGLGADGGAGQQLPRRPPPSGFPASPMRRNESAAAQLQDAGLPKPAGSGLSSVGEMRRNQSSNALSDLRVLENKNPSTPTNRRDVIEAVVLHLHRLMLADGAGPDAAEGATVRDAMQTYISTIVRQLELPNSCIVAMVIYVQRAVDDARFTLTVRNWQPCLLAAFVVAAKLSFDEPVWNEDFVKALRISNVQTSQISRWEADFLQLITFNTNVALEQYSRVCFSLQSAYEAAHGKRLQLFTFLMLQAKELETART